VSDSSVDISAEGPTSLKARGLRAVGPHVRRLQSGIVGQFWARLLELEFIERSIALAAKLFVSFFPVLIMTAVISPEAVRESIVSTLVSRFGLGGDQIDLVRGAFVSSDRATSTSAWIGLVVLVLYATSFTTALQRVYLRSWRRPKGGGVRNQGRGLMWILGVVVLITALAGTRRTLDDTQGSVAVGILAPLGSVGLWWWTAHVMLRGEVRWRPLLPTALVSGLGATIYAFSASIWMPRLVESHVEKFGFFGVSLACVTWFVGLAFLIVGAAAAGPVLAEADNWLGRWLRADDRGDPGVLTPGAPPALPAPPVARGLLGSLESALGQDMGDVPTPPPSTPPPPGTPAPPGT